MVRHQIKWSFHNWQHELSKPLERRQAKELAEDKHNWVNSVKINDRHFTLLYWILFMSKLVCGRPGNRNFRVCSRVSARFTKILLFSVPATSPLTLPPHDDLTGFTCLELLFKHFCFQMWAAASIVFAISRVLYSDDRSKQSRRHSGEKLSAVKYL